MLKERVTYKDYDGRTVIEDLYFNVTEVELGENLHIKDDFENWMKSVGATDDEIPERELTIPEVQELLRLVKFTLKLAYGVRTDDGKRFIKNEQVWEEFTQTAVYSQFLMSLFQIEPETGLPKANSWMRDVMPESLREQVDKAPALQQRPPTQDHMPKQERPVRIVETPPPAKDAVITQQDLVNMSPEQFQEWQNNQHLIQEGKEPNQ